MFRFVDPTRTNDMHTLYTCRQDKRGDVGTDCSSIKTYTKKKGHFGWFNGPQKYVTITQSHIALLIMGTFFLFWLSTFQPHLNNIHNYCLSFIKSLCFFMINYKSVQSSNKLLVIQISS